MPKVTKNKASTRESLLLAAKKQRDAIANEMYEDARQRLLDHFDSYPCVKGNPKAAAYYDRPVELHTYSTCAGKVHHLLTEDWGEGNGLSYRDITDIIGRAFDSLAIEGFLYTDHNGHVILMDEEEEEQ